MNRSIPTLLMNDINIKNIYCGGAIILWYTKIMEIY